jgi:DnaK suppressor protein
MRPDHAGAGRNRRLPRTDKSMISDSLEGERLVVVDRLQALHAELNGMITDAVDTNADDEHDPEGSTLAYERTRVTALLADAQSHLNNLTAALVRLDSGSYSICETCGRTIPTERLEAVPTCRTCIGCAPIRHPALRGFRSRQKEV